MIRKLLFPVLLAAALSSSAAEPTVSYNVNAGTINSISTNCGLSVVYTPANATSVKVTTPKNVRQYLDIRVDNGKLTATVTKNEPNRIKVQDVVISVSAPTVTDFEASSAGSIRVNGYISLPSLEVDIEANSAGCITIQSIKCKKAEIEASSAGNVAVTTSCNIQELEVESSSAANVSIKGIQSTVVEASASSAADIHLSGKTSSSKLEASSGGNVKASGLTASTGFAEASSGGAVVCNVKKLNKQTSSGGRVKNNN